MAVYFSQLQPGDTILAMSLAEGGHLTHGHPMNFSGRLFNIVPYGVNQETEQIDYENIQKLAQEHQPKLIVAGASAYSRIIDFKRIREIADEVGALMMVDMVHISGLVAAGCHPNPVPHADFVTTTTHKPYGVLGVVSFFVKKPMLPMSINIFSRYTRGPLIHAIAAKAVCFGEALQPAFKDYMKQVVKNAVSMATALTDESIRLVWGHR